MGKSLLTGYVFLIVLLVAVIVLPAAATAGSAAPAPTTLGEITEHTSPAPYYMLIGAGIVAAAGLLIVWRYRR